MSKKQREVLKKLVTFAIVVVFIISAFSTAVAKDVKRVKAPTLNATYRDIVIGKSFNFNINNKIKGSTYFWESSDPKVATVNEKNGVVTGVSRGTAIITCTIKSPVGTYLLDAHVTIRKPAVRVTITNPIKHLNVGDYYRLRTELIPATSNDIITWTSSDSKIAYIEEDGSFVALKSGTVTLKATTASGRSDSVTIQVVSDGQAPSETTTPDGGNKEDAKDNVKVIKTVLNETFESSAGLFKGRGDATAVQTTAGVAAEGKGYLRITGRSANWHGTTADVTSIITPGATYRVSGWVRYTAGADVETFKVTQQRNNNEYPDISGNVEVKKGVWTKISGIMEVTPNTSNCQVYFETLSTIDFFVDHVVIEQIEAEPVKEKVVETQPVNVGDIVYKNGFEDGRVLDSRGSSERKIVTSNVKSGKHSLEVKRTAGWDGAGVRFISDNKITKENYFGRTVKFSVYVMYKEGPAEVNFKLNNRMEVAENSDNILTMKAVKKGEWTLIEADCFIAKNAQGNMIFIETENNDALTFYMDDVEIKVVK